MTAEPGYRLPRTVEPERYDLTLTPDLAAAAFSGEERIGLRVLEPVTELVLNAAELDIHSAELTGADGAILAGSVTMDDEAERAVVALDGTAEPGEWTLHLTFSGVLNDKLRGFYRSTFTDEASVSHTIATTQFEATDARRAFPCWDEPDRKAVFVITLIVDADLLAVSNGAVVERTDLGNGRHQVEFAPTMRMSTYLVAFVIGPLVSTDALDVDGVPLRVVCVPGKERLTAFALEIGAHSLRFFSRYFGIAYPGGKLDLLALPDFAMGAMENLGAVTFRESLLLIDASAATRTELERVADVVAHEIAHMWFGDLVTMKWWNGIWLNEAFATFMELLCVDEFRPDWDRWTTAGIDRNGAMVIDGLSSTRAIEFPVADPREAEQMFDPLTYQKGAGVLRMLERYIGAEGFRNGIASYIEKHSYSNTETTDLWDAIEAATDEPARTTMDSWIYQGGHPIVSVSVNGAEVSLSQRIFRYRGGEEEGPLWQVPVVLRASVGGKVERHRTLLGSAAGSMALSGPPDWVVANDGGWGVYRTRYASELLRALMGRLTELSPLERFTLVTDTFAAVQAGMAPLADFVSLVRTMGATETDASVWSAVIGALSWLDRVTEDAHRGALQAFVRQLLYPVLDRLGWSPTDSEGERTHSLRASVISALGGLGADPDVRAQARALHDRYLVDRSSVDPDVAGALVAVIAASGGPDDWSAFVERWRSPATPQEELRYLYGLAGFEDLDLVSRTLELAFDEVRTQNAPFLVSLLLSNRTGGPHVWTELKARWGAVSERCPENLLDRMLDGVVALSRPELAEDVRSFLAAHPVPARARSIEQIVERLEVAVAFRQREAAALASVWST